MAAKNGSQGPPRAHPRGHRGRRLGRQRKQTRDESMPVRSAQRVIQSSQTRATLTGPEPWPQPRQASGGLGGTLQGRRGTAGNAPGGSLGEGPGRRDSDIHRIAVPPALQAAGIAGVLAPAAVRAIVHDAAPAAHLVVMAEAAVALDGQGAAPEVAAPAQRRGGPALNHPLLNRPGRTGPGQTGPGWTGGRGTTPGETLTHDGASEGRWKNPIRGLAGAPARMREANRAGKPGLKSHMGAGGAKKNCLYSARGKKRPPPFKK